MLLSDYKLLDTHQYAQDLVKEVNQAKDRVCLAVTTFVNDGDIPELIITSLISAAQRGVDVSIAADAFTYTELKNRSLVKRVNQAKKLSQKLRSTGVKIHWMGRSSLFSMTGRTHSKWYIVDNTVYSFGGINLDQRSFDNLDYMVRIKNTTLADKLASEHKRMIKADRSGHSYRSFDFKLKKDRVLLDGGLVGGSIIYRRACELAAKSKRATLVSQYCPTGKLGRILKKSDSRLYFNHWSKADGPNRLLIRYGMLLGRQSTHYQRVPYLHAKFIVFEMENGHKIALTGSHNFVYGGVLAGTREIALETEDKRLIRQLEAFLKHHIA